MELWIRSQDREKICKVIKLYIKGVGIYSNCDNYNDDYDYLGIYKTKERALEVLDEIQRLIKPTFKINYEYDDSQPIIDGEWLKSLKAESKIEELSCYVYEMPKE